jgi:heme-degrading monooxygenase HmoA
VITRWHSEEDIRAWVERADFAAGHAQHRERGPVGTDSEIWSFDLLESKDPSSPRKWALGDVLPG